MPAAASEPRDAASAEELFQRAKAALAAGDLAKACADFSESQRLDPAAGTLLNLADCEERQGKLATAWQHFTEARDKLGPGDFRHSFAQERIDALAPRVPRLTVRLREGAPRDARVFRDDVELGPPSLGLALPVDPGKHLLLVRAPAHKDNAVEYVADPGEQRVMTVELGPALPAPPPAPKPPLQRGGAPAPHYGAARTAGFIALGIGVVGVAVGTVAGIVTIDAANRYKSGCQPDGACTPAGLDAAATGRTFQVVSPVALGVGVAALGIGTYLVIAGSRQSPTAAIAPMSGPGGNGVALQGSFR